MESFLIQILQLFYHLKQGTIQPFSMNQGEYEIHLLYYVVT